MTHVSPTGWHDSDTELFLRFADAFVPRRAEQLTTVCSLLTQLPPQRVLELGCGAGALTDAVLAALPSSQVTAVDSSHRMVAIARERLRPFGGRVAVDQADLTNVSEHTGPWNAIITSLAVHHLEDDGKRRLYRDVYDLLRPGGLFVQVDMFLPATHAGHAAAAELWDRLVEAQSPRLSGTDEAFEAFQQSRWNTFHHPDPADHLAPLGHQLLWLTEAGFTGVDVAWALAGHAVLTATKPGGEPAR